MNMSFEMLVTHLGYPALILGLLFEGETVLVLGAFMARLGHLNLPLVILIGFLVTFASDQFFFWLGRTHGNQLIQQRAAWKSNVDKARPLLHRNTILLFIGYRFMYGFRTVMPFVFGLTRFDPKRFALWSFIGTFVWVLVFGIAGYAFGHAMEILMADVRKYEPWIVPGIVLIGGSILWLCRRQTDKVAEKAVSNE
jgi:membrane protein DedA with SNARE-associated domain